MVTKLTNQVISTYDHSHDLLTWSWHVTYPDIKSLLIPISASLFLCHEYIWVFSLSRLHYFYILVSLLLQYAFSAYHGPRADAGRSTRKTTSRFQWWWHKRGLPQSLLMKATKRFLPDQRLSRFQWWWHKRGFSLIAINESYW